LCHVGAFNQSHASLTSPEAFSALQKLATSNPSLYNEFTVNIHNGVADDNVDPNYFAESKEDIGVVNESDTPVDVVIEHIIAKSAGPPQGFLVRKDGGLARSGNVEDPDGAGDTHMSEEQIEDPANVPEPVLGQGQRKKKASQRYVVIVTGNSGVSQGYPYPTLNKPVPLVRVRILRRCG
jgi:hypothetical protein